MLWPSSPLLKNRNEYFPCHWVTDLPLDQIRENNKREENERGNHYNSAKILWRIVQLLCVLWLALWWPQSRSNSALPPSLDPQAFTCLLPKESSQWLDLVYTEKTMPVLRRLPQLRSTLWSARLERHAQDFMQMGMFVPRGWITSALSPASSLKLTWLKPILGRYS